MNGFFHSFGTEGNFERDFCRCHRFEFLNEILI